MEDSPRRVVWSALWNPRVQWGNRTHVYSTGFPPFRPLMEADYFIHKVTGESLTVADGVTY